MGPGAPRTRGNISHFIQASPRIKGEISLMVREPVLIGHLLKLNAVNVRI